MSFATDLRSIATAVRGIATDFGVRPYSVAIRVKSWTGEERGEGNQDVTRTTRTVTLHEGASGNPKVRWLTTEQLAIAGVGLDAELVEVGPITPDNTTRSLLSPIAQSDGDIGPVLNNASTVEWVLTGPKYPNGATFTLRELRDDRGYQFRAVLKKSP